MSAETQLNASERNVAGKGGIGGQGGTEGIGGQGGQGGTEGIGGQGGTEGIGGIKEGRYGRYRR